MVEGVDKYPKFEVFKRSMEHIDWTSIDWVTTATTALAYALFEARIRDRSFQERLGQVQGSGDANAIARAIDAAIAFDAHNSELDALAKRFMELRDEFRPRWSGEKVRRKDLVGTEGK